MLSPVLSVHLSAWLCSLQRFTHKNYMKIQIVFWCTILAQCYNSYMLFDILDSTTADNNFISWLPYSPALLCAHPQGWGGECDGETVLMQY